MNTRANAMVKPQPIQTVPATAITDALQRAVLASGEASDDPIVEMRVQELVGMLLVLEKELFHKFLPPCGEEPRFGSFNTEQGIKVNLMVETASSGEAVYLDLVPEDKKDLRPGVKPSLLTAKFGVKRNAEGMVVLQYAEGSRRGTKTGIERPLENAGDFVSRFHEIFVAIKDVAKVSRDPSPAKPIAMTLVLGNLKQAFEANDVP